MPWDERIGKRLKLKDLQMLMAIVEAGGIGKAAQRLNYSQPAVSKAVASLERAFGKRLLERGRKGIELTPYGDALMKCGAAVFDDLRKGFADLEFLSDPTVGEVRIGCTEPVSAGFMSSLMDRLARRYPRIAFQVEVSNPRAIYTELGARKLDFGIVQTYAPVDHAQLHMEVLYDDALLIVSGTQHPAASKRRIKIADLADERWALPPGESFAGKVLAAALRAEGLPPPIVAVTTHSTYWRVLVVASGHFLTILPSVMLNAQSRRMPIKALPVKLRGNTRPVGIVTLKDRALSPVAQLVIEHARTLARTIARD